MAAFGKNYFSIRPDGVDGTTGYSHEGIFRPVQPGDVASGVRQYRITQAQYGSELFVVLRFRRVNGQHTSAGRFEILPPALQAG